MNELDPQTRFNKMLREAEEAAENYRQDYRAASANRYRLFSEKMYGPYDPRPFVGLLDMPLIAFCVYAAFQWPEFAGGWGWFLLLGLSPRAWKIRNTK